MYITHVFATHVLHLYVYTSNTHKTPHMYYRTGVAQICLHINICQNVSKQIILNI